jgi:hypothetical protein
MDVEVLDVTEEEARTLLLSIDPLAALAQTQEQLHDRLRELTPTDSAELRAAWESAVAAALEAPAQGKGGEVALGPEQWLILVSCRDERQQLELLTRFQAEGLACRALLA